ncbi:pirin family protein [Psychroserpens damuponensis]|uniref:pirin family protein n=1 Tax=Psychroserpens damuponensis TaxID=943936 RepID=UPI0005904989|nr:pirin family protein [Psychroserpens damuponensis]
MKTIVHRANNRGFANHGWLQAHHSFSFASFYDNEKINFGALRVLNDDIIAPKMGFGTHPHDNMEIITIPLKGVLKHKDDIVHDDWQEVLPGEVQVMSAGTGVQHSEINGSINEHLSLFQIWIIPNQYNVSPRYDQKHFNKKDRENKLQILVSSMDDANDDVLKIHQDAKISRLYLDESNMFDYTLKTENHGVYVMVISGAVTMDNQILGPRDALGVYATHKFSCLANENSELLFIEVPVN